MATNNNRLAGQVYLGSTNSLEIYNISISGQNPTITLVNSTPSVVTSFFNFIMGLCYVKDNILGLLTYTHHGTFTNNDPEKFEKIQESGFGKLGLGESGASPITERRGITKAESIKKVKEWLNSLQKLTPSTAPKTHSEAPLRESPGKKAKISETDVKSGR